MILIYLRDTAPADTRHLTKPSHTANHTMQLPENPFTDHPVGRELFTGRDDAIASVYQKCAEAMNRGQSKMIVLTGPRGIGKTSFLDRIRAGPPGAVPGKMFDLAVFDPVLPKIGKIDSKTLHDEIDMGVVKLLGRYRKRFKLLYGLKRLHRAFSGGGAGGVTLPSSAAVTMEDLLQRLRNASGTLKGLQHPTVLTILLDEMDPLLEAADGLPDFIRSCTEHVHCPLVFLLAGLPTAWNTICEAHWSIPRTADRIQLKPFEREEVTELMQTAVNLANRTATVRLVLAQGVSDQIFEITGGHPSLVQMLGHYSVERVLQTFQSTPVPHSAQISINKAIVTQAQQAVDFGRRVFDSWIHDLTNAERCVLWQIANIRKTQPRIDASVMSDK